MTRRLKVNSRELIPFVINGTYGSKLLTGGEMEGRPIININEGTLSPFARTAGAAHDETEIYYILSCKKGTAVYLGDERIETEAGDTIIIPPGVFHWIDNLNSDEPYILLTFWHRQEDNGMFHKRLDAWGTSQKFGKV